MCEKAEIFANIVVWKWRVELKSRKVIDYAIDIIIGTK